MLFYFLSGFRAVSFITASCMAVGLLGGCVENTPGFQLESAKPNEIRASALLPSGLSPHPASMAIVQIEGAPESVNAQFRQFFTDQAARKDIEISDSAKARYLAHGYLSAFPSASGAVITYVWDIYDRANHRALRLNDEVTVGGAASDPWTLANSAALTALATNSAEDVAAFLSNTPEAVAAARNVAATTTTVARSTPSSPLPLATATGSQQVAPTALTYAPLPRVAQNE